MRQGLIDKFEIAHGMSLSRAVSLNQALLDLPEEVIGEKVESYSHPAVCLGRDGVVSIRYTDTSEPNNFPVVFPKDAKDCVANGRTCFFKYRGRKYRIN